MKRRAFLKSMVSVPLAAAIPASVLAAASVANTLDDYEEGEFTPTFTFSGAGVTGASPCHYVRVGNTVHFSAIFRVGAA